MSKKYLTQDYVLKRIGSWPERLKKSGMSQAALARSLELSPMSVSRWFNYEKHKVIPSIENIEKVERILTKKGA